MKYLIPILLAFSLGAVQADWSQIAAGKAKVISTTGLSMRAKPNMKARRLMAVPHNTIVEVLETSDMEAIFDTLPDLPAEGEGLRGQRRGGFWAKVRYKGRVGYMFDIYLAALPGGPYDPKPHPGMNDDFLLLRPEVGCRNNFFYQPGWHYYGLYHDPATGYYSLAATKVSQFIQRQDIEWYHYRGANMNQLKFIIGSRTPLSRGLLKGGRSLAEFQTYLRADLRSGTAQDSAFRAHGFSIVPSTDQSEKGYRIRIKRNGKSQTLNAPPFETHITVVVHFMGDIDRDGQTDYILTFGEKSAETVLFLSSQARKGQLVRPVAIFFSGYCC